MEHFAHSRNTAGKRQELQEHLHNVADTAQRYASAFGAALLARYTGLLHDIGKYDPAFQQYLFDAERKLAKKRGPDHKGAGSVLASEEEPQLLASFIIAGHHGGLPALKHLKSFLREREANKTVQEAIITAKSHFPELQTIPERLIPTHLQTPLEEELFTRMTFSALVDADFLDTEQHFDADRSTLRNQTAPITDILKQFETKYQQKFAMVEQSQLNDLRAEVFQHCLEAATKQPGFFRLTVPTGGGKTLSSLGFALRHAQQYGLERIIYAIPYTSIIEQTVDVFKEVVPDEQAILEHHSSLIWKDPEQPTPTEIKTRLAAENWNATLIVTTTVQLFESLLGHTPQACRKLHHIARSVIVLDEVQMLPTHLLTTILNVLRQLVAHYGVTVVLCTATQPDFDTRSQFEGLPTIREIIPHAERLFEHLKRVEYQLPRAGESWTWEQVAEKVRAENQILVVVNTRRDAVSLLDALSPSDSLNEQYDPALFHLSTRLCGAHRRAVLEEVRRRLKAGEPCHLVATQVIEAGVDVDFPLVMRALGPLDRIVQAAGRCNREGKHQQFGRVIVFVPEDGSVPPGPYKTGTGITSYLFKRGRLDLHDPALYQKYFRDYYSEIDRDKNRIEAARTRFDFPEVAANFRMIEDDTSSVVVKYPSHPETEETTRIVKSLEDICHKPTRALLRTLQPYMVNLRKRELEQAHQQGLVQELIPGVWEWQGDYDHVYGIVLNGVQDAERNIW